MVVFGGVRFTHFPFSKKFSANGTLESLKEFNIVLGSPQNFASLMPSVERIFVCDALHSGQMYLLLSHCGTDET